VNKQDDINTSEKAADGSIAEIPLDVKLTIFSIHSRTVGVRRRASPFLRRESAAPYVETGYRLSSYLSKRPDAKVLPQNELAYLNRSLLHGW
jgi:hypothetical protein